MRGPNRLVIVGNNEIGIGGDLIMAIDGQTVERPDSLARILNKKRPGDTVELTVYRGRRQVKVKVTLGESPAEAL